MTGDYTAVARVDAKNKSYEAAIKKNDSLKLFGNPDANETSLKVDDANLRITKTSRVRRDCRVGRQWLTGVHVG